MFCSKNVVKPAIPYYFAKSQNHKKITKSKKIKEKSKSKSKSKSKKNQIKENHKIAHVDSKMIVS